LNKDLRSQIYDILIDYLSNSQTLECLKKIEKVIDAKEKKEDQVMDKVLDHIAGTDKLLRLF